MIAQISRSAQLDQVVEKRRFGFVDFVWINGVLGHGHGILSRRLRPSEDGGGLQVFFIFFA